MEVFDFMPYTYYTRMTAGGGKNVTLAPSSGRSSAIAVRIDLCCAKVPTGGIKTHGPKGRYHHPLNPLNPGREAAL